MLAPKSRRWFSTAATPTSPSATTSIMASTHQRLPANARTSSAQPVGDSQVSQVGPSSETLSPMARST